MVSKNKEKILIFSDSDNIGGVEKRYSNLYKYLISAIDINENVIFLINKKLVAKIDSYQLQALNKNINLYTFGSFINSKKYRFLSRLIDAITILIWAIKYNNKFDLALFTTTRSMRYSFLIRAKIKITVVYAYTLKAFSKSFNKYEKLAKRNFVFDCLSEDIAKELLKSNIIPKNKIKITPNSFIDFENTDNNFNEKNNTVSYVARFTEIKGVSLLLDTMCFVLKNSENIKFEIFGYGPMENDIINFIEHNSYSDRVTVGYTANAKEHLRKSKIFLSLQHDENYPSQSLLEAMACKNVIVATNVGLTYKLVDNKCGILVSKNGDEIGKAVLELFEKSNLSVFGENSRRKVLNTHTPSKYYKYLLSLK